MSLVLNFTCVWLQCFKCRMISAVIENHYCKSWSSFVSVAVNYGVTIYVAVTRAGNVMIFCAISFYYPPWYDANVEENDHFLSLVTAEFDIKKERHALIVCT
jgi:hypothetical protein